MSLLEANNHTLAAENQNGYLQKEDKQAKTRVQKKNNDDTHTEQNTREERYRVLLHIILWIIIRHTHSMCV